MVERSAPRRKRPAEEAVKQAREEGRAEAMAAQQAQEADAVRGKPAADELPPPLPRCAPGGRTPI